MRFQKAFVTGASSGIGTALSRLLAEQGISLVIHGRDEGRLNSLAEELRTLVPVEIVVGDVADKGQRAEVIAAVHRMSPDLLVNNAGMGLYGEALSYSTAEQMNIFSINAEAVLELTLEAARTWVTQKKEGVVMNVSSVASFIPMPYFSVYCASKAFVTHLSEGLDAELKPRGIRVLVSCPGVVKTAFNKRALQGGQQPPQRMSVMTAEFAAAEIWRQIVAEKPLHTFNWFYRLTSFLVRYLLPRRWLFSAIRRQWANYLSQRPIIPL